MARRFLAAFFVLIVSTILQLSAGTLLGFYPSLAAASLITISLFVSFPELIFFISLSVLILNWQPALSWDLLVLALPPVVAFFIRRFFKLRRWIVAPSIILLALLASYLVFALLGSTFSPVLLIDDALVSLIFGMAVFYIFNKYLRAD